jgi:hypothetical protein
MLKRARRTSLDLRLMQYRQSYTHQFVSSTFSSDTQRPSGVKAWQMPAPVVEPMPLPSRESRWLPPLLAQEASYLAASARMASLS